MINELSIYVCMYTVLPDIPLFPLCRRNDRVLMLDEGLHIPFPLIEQIKLWEVKFIVY
jgi:hypothetical protein